MLKLALLAAMLGPTIDRLERRGFQGAIRVSDDNRTLVSKGFGLANRRTQLRNRPSLAYPLASVSKPITAIAALSLAQTGDLDLDAPISEHLDTEDDLTARDLLLHRAGLPNYLPGAIDTSRVSRRAAVRRALEAKRTKRGVYRYSDCSYIVLAALIEAAADEPFEQVVRERVLKPARMKNAGFWGDRRFSRANAVHAYAGGGRDDGATALRRPPSFAILGAGGLVASPTDLDRLMRALERGRVLDEKRLRLLTTPAIDEGPRSQATLGLASVKIGGVRAFFFTGAGNSNGETAAFAWLPDCGVRVAIAANDARVRAYEALPGVARAVLRGGGCSKSSTT